MYAEGATAKLESTPKVAYTPAMSQRIFSDFAVFYNM